MVAPFAISDRLIALVAFSCLVLVSGDTANPAVNINNDTAGGSSGQDINKCDPKQATFRPIGVTAAVSMRDGALDVTWGPTKIIHPVHGEFAAEECEGFVHELFVAEGEINFAEWELEDLRANNTVHNHESTNFTHTLKDLKSGLPHTVLVIAKGRKDWVSSNREGKHLNISATNPILKEDVTSLENVTDDVVLMEEDGHHKAYFLAQHATHFKKGAWITGVDMNGDPYIVELLAFQTAAGVLGRSPKGLSVWTVQHGALSDIYHQLEIHASVHVPPHPDDASDDGSSGDGASDDGSSGDGASDDGASGSDVGGGKKLMMSARGVGAKATHRHEKKFHVSHTQNVEALQFHYSVDFGFWLDYHARIKRKGFHPVIDASAKLAVFADQTASFKMKKSISTAISKTVSLKKWKKKKIKFEVGPVPVWATVTPITDVVVTAEAKLQGSFNATASSNDTFDWQVRYYSGRKTKWSGGPSIPSPHRDLEYNIDGRASLDLYGGLRLGGHVSVYGVFTLDALAEAGPDLSIKAEANPTDVVFDNQRSDNNRFRFTKFDVRSKGDLRVDARLHVFTRKYHHHFAHSFNQTLYRLPSVDIFITGHARCADKDAILLTVEMHPRHYEGLVANRLIHDYESVLVPSKHWVLQNQSHNPATMSLALKRSVIKDVDFFRLPEDGEVLYFATGATIPPLPFPYLLFQQDLESIKGMPDIKKFDCCDDNDCEMKQKRSEEAWGPRVCKNYECVKDRELHEPDDSESNSEL